MQLGSVRALPAMRPVLLDPAADGPDPVYWVFYLIARDGVTAVPNPAYLDPPAPRWLSAAEFGREQVGRPGQRTAGADSIDSHRVTRENR